MPSSRGSSQPRDWTQVSCTAGRFFTVWATREATAHYLLGPCNSSLLVFFLPLQHAMLLPASKIRHRVFPLPGNCFHSHPTLLSCPPFLDKARSFLRSPSRLGSCVHSLMPTTNIHWMPTKWPRKWLPSYTHLCYLIFLIKSVPQIFRDRFFFYKQLSGEAKRAKKRKGQKEDVLEKS